MFYVYLTKPKGKKLVFSSSKYRETLSFYHSFLENNKKNIVYPKRYISNKKEVSFERYYIFLIDEQKKVLLKNEYLVEEKFYVYGAKKRYTVEQLFEKVFLKFVENFTSVRMFKNKIVLESGDDIECILTKNLSECDRLYNFVKSAVQSKKIYSLLFLGKIPEKPREMKIELIQKLVAFTGLSHYQFKRNSTRH
jgi:hypothetical protein